MQSMQQNMTNNINQNQRTQNYSRDEERKKILENETKKFESKLMNYFGNEFYERKLEITPKRIPLENFLVSDDYEKLIPNIKIYKYLQNLEKEIDDKIYKSRLDIQEQIIKPNNIIKSLLRTHIFAYIDKDEHFVLKIQGKIIENFPENEYTKIHYYFQKFSHYFSKVKIIFENNIYQEIEWRNMNKTKMSNNNIDNNQEQNYLNYEGFIIQKPIIDNIKNKNFKIEILFYLNYPNPEFSLTPELSNLLGINQGTRTNILYHMWQYIKLNSLQDNENPTRIINNTQLQQIFKCEKIDIVSLTGKLNEFLKEPPPIVIKFDINNLSDNYKDNEILKDLIIPIEDPYFNSILFFLHNSDDNLLFPKHLIPLSNNQTKIDEYLNQIIDSDKKMNTMINILNKHKYRYDFYEAYSKDPIRFINNFIIQQNELIKIVDENSLIENRNDYTSSQYCKDYEEVIRGYVDKFIANQYKNTNINQN